MSKINKEEKIQELEKQLSYVNIFLSKYRENTSLSTIKKNIESIIKYWKEEFKEDD